MKFTGVCLVTDDVLALAAFYTKVLGCPAEGDSQHAEIHFGAASIAIFTRTGMEEMAPGSTKGAGNGLFTLGFEVDDVDFQYQLLLESGVPIVKPPASYPWGTRSVWFRDPAGNILNFYCQVKA